MINLHISKFWLVIVVGVLGVLAGYFLGYDHGYEEAVRNIEVGIYGGDATSFEECAARYPVMESYPRQCNTPDGRHFVEDPPAGGEGDGIACPADAKLCPDGSYVGRTGPNCEFVCPNS